MGLGLGETLALQAGDIDGARKQVPIRRGKGHQDRLLPLPDSSYQALRALCCKHRNPRWLFPGAQGSMDHVRRAITHLDRSGTRAAMKAVVQQCGIKKKSPLSGQPGPPGNLTGTTTNLPFTEHRRDHYWMNMAAFFERNRPPRPSFA